jgi:alginate O-acetyltransferase complex protein AlgI
VLFVTAVAILYQACPVRWRNCFLLAVSYLFYFTWSLWAAAVLAVATLLAFFAGEWAVGTKSKAKVTTFAAVMALIAYLFFFKVIAVLPNNGLARLAMPLGLSYYTFKLISYVLDVHWGKIEPERRLTAFAAYVAFFPQIVAGPIQRAGDFLEQVPPPRTGALRGIPRIAWGFAKKMFIADQLAPAISYVFAHVHTLHSPALMVGFYLFPLQLYADFSALTDVAIGTGQLFGVQGPENFDRPFTAANIAAFWRRWHMSLTSWLTDYVFTPLRIATREAGRAGLAFSITVNFIAIGLWHGLSWGYFVFGAVNAFYLNVDALTARERNRFFKAHPRLDSLGNWLGWLMTFHLVAVALVFFRASRVSDATFLLSHLVSGLSAFSSELRALVITSGAHAFALGITGYALLELAERFRPDRRWARVKAESPRWVRWSVNSAVATLIFVGILMLITEGGSQKPFLYAIY